MQVIVKYNLDVPEDKYEYENSLQASEVRLELEHLDQELRNMIKYGSTPDIVLSEIVDRDIDVPVEYITSILEVYAAHIRKQLPRFKE